MNNILYREERGTEENVAPARQLFKKQLYFLMTFYLSPLDSVILGENVALVRILLKGRAPACVLAYISYVFVTCYFSFVVFCVLCIVNVEIFAVMQFLQFVFVEA